MPSSYFESYGQMRDNFETKWLDWIANGKPVNIHRIADGRESPVTFGKSDGTTYTPRILWAGQTPETDPDPSEHWCRFWTDEISNVQQTFPASPLEKKRHRVKGIIIVQLFYSMQNMAHEHRKLSVIARDIFKPRNLKCNPIWYTNATIKTLANEGEKYFRYNVVADYQFDEFI